MYQQAEKRKRNGFGVIAIMLFFFCVLKVIRGADTSSTTEGGIWNYISVLYYVIAFFGFLRNKSHRIKTLFVAPLLYSIISMILSLGTTDISLSLSKLYPYLMIPYFFLVFVSFYFYSDYVPSAEKLILCAYAICLLINAMTILGFLMFGRLRAMPSDVYFSLCLFPFALLFIKHKVWKMVVVIAQFFISFLSNKRAGFIALCIALAVYYLLELYSDKHRNFFKVLKRIILIGLAIWLLYYISVYIDTIFGFGIYDRLNRLKYDDGSGRGDIYIAVWRAIKNSNWLELLFGHGMNTAGKVVGAGYAHNDFLEVLYDYGILAFLCLVVYYVSIIVQAIKMIIRKSPYASAFVVSVIIGISLSSFSYFLIYYTYVTCTVAFWGYVVKMEDLRLSKDSVFEKTQKYINGVD